MENHSNFVIYVVGREVPLVLFLKLLIWVIIYTRPVNCLPTQETNFKIPVFEKTSILGFLYDQGRTGIYLDRGINHYQIGRSGGPHWVQGPKAPVYLMYKKLGAHAEFPQISYGQSAPVYDVRSDSLNPMNMFISNQIPFKFPTVSEIKIMPSKLGSTTINKKQKREAEPHRTKVVGGNNANPNEFPFQVIFLTPDIHCGGSILNENFILTAAHCFYDGVDRFDAEDYKFWTIVAGDHNREIDDGTEQRREIEEVFVHKQYRPYSEINDLAIVKLDRPLQFSKQVQSIVLPDKNYNASGDAVVTGWGTLRYKGSNPLVLQKVTVPIVEMETCVKAYEEEQVLISIYKLCAGDMVKGGVDACQGDSGGPLSVKLSNGSFLLVGVVSSGIECGRKEFSGIYMKVSKYVDWIDETLINFDKCQLRERCQNGGTCVNGNKSFSCFCANGFSGKYCQYLAECRYPATCAPPSDAEYCHRCRDGFFKDPEDDSKCKYANSSASLIISFKKGIQMISPGGLNTTQMIQSGDSVKGIDINYGTSTIFWFSYTNKRIYQGSIKAESEKQSIFHDSSSDILGVAVDWIHHHVYWVDIGRKQLCVSNFNGAMKKVLFNGTFSWPYSIAVNPLNGWMYWAEYGYNRIERAGLDGSQREVIVNCKDPYSLVVDFVDNRLYWTQERNQSSIWSSDFDGSDQKLILRANQPQFGSSFFWKIATFDRYVFFIDDYTDYSKSIYKVNKCNGKELELIHKSNHNLLEIKIYHETMQPKGENVCLKRSLPCTHFCFPVPSAGNALVLTTTCACPDGLSLSADQRNCV